MNEVEDFQRHHVILDSTLAYKSLKTKQKYFKIAELDKYDKAFYEK